MEAALPALLKDKSSIMSKKKITLYCSSRGDLPEDIIAGAELTGRTIGAAEATLVYGGVNAGLMHTVARAVADAGGKVHGVVPEIFRHRADTLCNEITWARDLNHRKGIMISEADAFVVLPGGIGTIDEWISTLSHILAAERRDADADRPILVWNREGMYDAMIEMLRQSDESLFGQGRRASRSRNFASAEKLASELSKILSS